ncbi:MAG TPA: hypothetical protein VF956_01360 [Candidatus Dormibacteraeota bacterium]
MRFLYEVGARVVRLTRVVNARPFVVKPFVLLAARVMGPGPLRLKMVKLAHELDDRQVSRAAA